MEDTEKVNASNKKSSKITSFKQAKRIIIIVIGFTVLLIGIVGLVLPVLQGTVAIILGFAILGSELVWAKKLSKRFGEGANNIKNSIFNNSQHKKKQRDKGTQA